MATKKAARPAYKASAKTKSAKKPLRKTVKHGPKKVTRKRVAYKRVVGTGVIHEVSIASASDVRKTLGIDRDTIKAVAQALAN